MNALDEIVCSPLGAAALRFAAGEPLCSGPLYSLGARILRGPGAFGGPAEVLVLLALSGTEIPLTAAAGSLRDFLAAAGIRRSRCRWLLLSDHGGIYLHEAVTSDPSWRIRGSRNRLCVLGVESGSVSLGPGHERNRALSERFRSLLERYRLTNRPQWEREVSETLALCLESMVK